MPETDISKKIYLQVCDLTEHVASLKTIIS